MRWVAVWLVLVLTLFTFETGIHSVHHLGHPDDSERGCALASARTHVEPAGGEGVTLPPLTLIPLAVLIESAPARCPVRAPLHPQQRAPPLALVA